MTGIQNGFMTMSNESYHSGPGVSKSGLDLVEQSPVHYWQRYLNPDREPEKETPAKRLGTATHTAVLEPDEFTLRYIGANTLEQAMKDLGAIPDSVAGLKEACEARGVAIPSKSTKDTMLQALLQADPDAPLWNKVAASVVGERKILTLDEMTYCLAMRDAVHRHPLAGRLLKNGVAEQSVFATDRDTGLLRKCRPDWLTTNGGVLDLKTCEDASPRGFGRASANYRYHVAGAWYPDTIEQAIGERPPFFLLVAAEKNPPYAVACYFVDELQQRAGRRVYEQNLRTLAECFEHNVWPGYSQEAEPLTLPPWADGLAEERRESEGSYA